MTQAASAPGSTAGREVTARGRSTRDRIVRAAAELMFLRGVAGTSIPDVLEAAGVSASQVYHYFGDKHGLVRAVIAHQIEVALEHQRPVLDRLDSFEALELWRDGVIAVQRARDCRGGCEIGSLAGELVETDAVARADLVAAFDRWETPIRTGLRAMQRRGELSADADPARLATAMLAAVQGGLLLTQVRRSTEPLYAAITAVIDHIRTFAVAAYDDDALRAGRTP
ncbi:TetR/AcrR family transcriptional regulator [Actinomadura scrupuli]|uniref:TetR/AcrR family transcriptional regulator n=1 Tax=Actinomadura scrupuli TaxID=559629 RepID=UPI003D9738D9